MILKFDIVDDVLEPSDSETYVTILRKYYRERQNRTSWIKIAKANLELAEQDIKIAHGAYQPSLNGFIVFLPEQVVQMVWRWKRHSDF
jgi:outer membrane protein